MKTLLNIERSAFRKGEFVGYCYGVWRIQPARMTGRNGWHATRKVWQQQRKGEPFCFQSHTLEGISAMLAKEQQITRETK